MRATVKLPGVHPPTTPLGLGLATLMREPSRAKQRRLLGAAYEAGFRHFDVAPSYGLGAAETLLGSFLNVVDDATVGTKVGIRARGSSRLMRAIQRPARALLRSFPSLRGRATRAVGSAVHTAPDFSVEFCARSLEESRRALRRERIDLLLLHEVTMADLVDGGTIDWLREQKERGIVGAIGVATGAPDAMEILARWRKIFDVVQTQSHVLAPVVDALSSAPLVITHSVLAAPLAPAVARAGVDTAWTQTLSRIVGEDVNSSGMLARLLLACALAENPRGIVLVGSSSERHIREAPRAVGAFPAPALASAADFLRATLTGTPP